MKIRMHRGGRSDSLDTQKDIEPSYEAIAGYLQGWVDELVELDDIEVLYYPVGEALFDVTDKIYLVKLKGFPVAWTDKSPTYKPSFGSMGTSIPVIDKETREKVKKAVDDLIEEWRKIDHGIVVVCDETNNSLKDKEQNMVNVTIKIPVPVFEFTINVPKEDKP